jgi:hypothetical protein
MVATPSEFPTRHRDIIRGLPQRKWTRKPN